MAKAHHECELYMGRVPEGEESEHNWKTCEKNPGHVMFHSAPDIEFADVTRSQHPGELIELQTFLNLTVRLRVRFTSQDRPDGFAFSDDRGTNKLRVGTGFITCFRRHVSNSSCSCLKCSENGERKQWEIEVSTAHHVVFDTQEARNTKVDLFYDDEKSQRDGRMKSVRGLEVSKANPDRDVSLMKCVTCDEDLAEQIRLAFCFFRNRIFPGPRNILSSLGLMTKSCRKGRDLVLVVSHPHAQPKKVTVGELKNQGKDQLRQYTTHTCPGSSGAPVFVFGRRRASSPLLYPAVHCGCFDDSSTERQDRPNLLQRLFNKLKGYKLQQLNYGHDW